MVNGESSSNTADEAGKNVGEFVIYSSKQINELITTAKYVGEGFTSNVYKAKTNGQEVAIKCYKRQPEKQANIKDGHQPKHNNQGVEINEPQSKFLNEITQKDKQAKGKGKEVTSIVPSKPQLSKAYKAELALLKHVQHENIVQLIGYFQDEEHKEDKCVVMKYYPLNLDKQLLDLNWYQTSRILNQMASALWDIHKKDFIVVDFKPENVLLTENFDAKIGDFGGSRKSEGYPEIFSPGYAAPEVIENSRAVTQSDIYSFGIVLLQLITKYKNIGLPTNKDNKTKHEGETYIVERVKELIENTTSVNESLVGVNCDMQTKLELLQFGLKCASKRIDQRPQTMQEVLDKLRNPLKGVCNAQESAKGSSGSKSGKKLENSSSGNKSKKASNSKIRR